MNDDFLERFTRSLAKPADLAHSTTDQETDGLEDYGPFGFLRGVRDRAHMLEIRRKDGNSRAFGMSWLHLAEFDPSVGIILSFGTFQVKLMGRNLNAEVRPNVRLFQGIIRQRVPFVQEADQATILQAPETATIIERVEW